jgi:hypothetical protein
MRRQKTHGGVVSSFFCALLVLISLPAATRGENAEAGNLKGKQIFLVKSGRACSQIVLLKSGDAVAAFAASELRDYIQRISGANIAMVETNRSGRDLTVIQFELGRPEDYRWDGYGMDVEPGRVTIRAATTRGLLYGAYEILEDLGCSWVYPGKEEIVPKSKTLSLAAGHTVRTPVIEHRGLALYGFDQDSVVLGGEILDWMAKNRYNLLLTSEDRPSDSGKSAAHDTRWRQVADVLLPEVQKRGFVLELSEHSTRLFFPRTLFDEHPDWFAMNSKGVRGPGQMCYSNPDGVEYYANRQAEYAARHPEISILGTWPLDGGGYCQCSNCAKPDAVFKMVAKVAEKVRRVRPDVTVEHLAYKDATYPVPTTIPVPENVSVLLCGRTDQLARDWVAATEQARGAYYFEYRTGDNWYWAANVWLRPGYVRDTAKTSADIGFRGVVSLFLPIQNWWRSCFNFYFMGRSYWDPGLSLDGELRNYCAAYYGRESDRVHDLFKLMTDGLENDELLKSQRAWAHAWPEEETKLLDPEGLARSTNAAGEILAKLAQAEKENHDPIIARRLSRIRMYVEYFQLYYQARQTRLEADKAALVKYAELHSSPADGVCMDPDYVRHILEKRTVLFK